MYKAHSNHNKGFLGYLRKVNLCFLSGFCKNENPIRLKFIKEINSVFQVLDVILMHKDIFRKNVNHRLIAAKDNKLFDGYWTIYGNI